LGDETTEKTFGYPERLRTTTMMTFNPEETAACQRLVELAWEEDLGPREDPFASPAADVTSHKLIPPGRHGQAVLVARAPGVVAGLPAVELVVSTVNTPLVKLLPFVEDGAQVQPGDRIATISGLFQFILMAERIALNFLQHLSGVATLTRRFVDAVAGFPCLILDTRKTLPGWRLLEKYAVRCGGGHNHRMGLYDAFLIKDSHLAILGIGKNAFQYVAVTMSGLRSLHGPIEIEVANLEELDWALACLPDIVLLDNMSVDQLREAVRRRNEKAPKVLLEASGGITLDTVRQIAETGVERISVGALTHSAPALDLALDYVT
jgi:nicotinate-nucleotide pyrophosphorylase (carboxylating)